MSEIDRILQKSIADDLANRIESIYWWHSIEIPGYGLTPGHEPDPHSRDIYLNIPADLTGKSVLDVGAWDGLYSFMAEERGAKSVCAVDTYPRGDHGIRLAVEIRRSAVHVITASVYDLPSKADIVDVVFCFGLLYHLTDPLRALCSIATRLPPGGLLILETDCALMNPDDPAMYFRPGYKDDVTNFWYPTPACVEGMLEYAGFSCQLQPGGIGSRRAWHACKKG